MIQTEKATHVHDLPHAPDIVEYASLMCKCGRWSEDPLHKAGLRETAGERPVLHTEKGS